MQFCERYEAMNKMIGIVKEIDGLGRIAIPKEYRERFMLEKQVEIVLTEKVVLIRNSKYELVKRETHKQRNVK